MMRELKNWWFARQNGYPSKDEMRRILWLTNTDPTSRTFQIGLAYVQGGATIESVAADFEVTRERVRQVLLKLQRGTK